METEVNGVMNGHIVTKSTAGDYTMETKSLREELERVNTEFMRANEERAKAAEYGLVLLEEKQQLQYRAEEYTALYETTKQELEMSTNTLRQVSRDYEKRIKDMERQREQLLVEMEEREKELTGKTVRLEEERRGLERQLKKTTSQNDFLVETNTTLNDENERLKKEISTQRDEVHSHKKKSSALQLELDQLQLEIDRARPKIDKLSQYEQEYYNLTEQNASLQSELTSLQEHYDSILHERDDLEQQARDVYKALNEEREAKSMLETRLQADMFKTPDKLQWQSPTLADDLMTSSAPTSPSHIAAHSTPFTVTAPTVPNLLSELQNSLLPQEEVPFPVESVQTLETKVRELEGKNSQLTAERNHLDEIAAAALSDLETWKGKYQEMIDHNEVNVSSLKDELAAKKEIVSQFKNKVSSLNGEKASLEIELEGVKDEMTRSKEAWHMESERLLKEQTEEQRKNSDLQSRISELEEKLSHSVSTRENLESILVHSTAEIISMREEILNVHKAVSSLHNENKFSIQPSPPSSVETSKAQPNNETSLDEYTLSVQEGKKTLQINRENQTVAEVTQLRELLRQVRIPLEGFTKSMLERSLETSSQHMISSVGKGNGDSARIMGELEVTMSKLRARLANRTEEVNQLRAIMKARQTTVDVTVSSLKSKLESQGRAHEAEISQFKHKLKTIRKERDDQTSLCALTSKRCQEYLGEIGKLKRRIDEARGESERLRTENKLVNVYLERAIKQKLEISQLLERYQEEEERNRVIPLTLSASRV